MIQKSYIFYVIYLNHVHILKSVIFQEVLNILYFKIIPTFSQKFDSDFWGPKLAHTLYSPLFIVFQIKTFFQRYSNIVSIKGSSSLPKKSFNHTSYMYISLFN